MAGAGSHAGSPGPLRAGLCAALLWLTVEAAIRWTDVAIVRWWDAVSARATPGTVLWVNVVLLIPTMLVLAWLFARRVRREGLTRAALDYRPWRVGIWPALGAVVVIFGMIEAFGPWEDALFRDERRERAWEEARRAAGWLVGLVAVPANGLLVPVVEEFAWRGYIQTRILLALGRPAGILTTALLFAAKHVVVDLSLDRVFTLMGGALVLGGVGARWGTQASTVTHVVLNVVATAAETVLGPLLVQRSTDAP
ncbi:MAG: type II CAAX endopeptidase family protein [Armatimonadota bacterium]|nr:type II CAAX endopeptidase family protein [Armatimonadota bacterium]